MAHLSSSHHSMIIAQILVDSGARRPRKALIVLGLGVSGPVAPCASPRHVTALALAPAHEPPLAPLCANHREPPSVHRSGGLRSGALARCLGCRRSGASSLSCPSLSQTRLGLLGRCTPVPRRETPPFCRPLCAHTWQDHVDGLRLLLSLARLLGQHRRGEPLQGAQRAGQLPGLRAGALRHDAAPDPDVDDHDDHHGRRARGPALRGDRRGWRPRLLSWGRLRGRGGAGGVDERLQRRLLVGGPPGRPVRRLPVPGGGPRLRPQAAELARRRRARALGRPAPGARRARLSARPATPPHQARPRNPEIT